MVIKAVFFDFDGTISDAKKIARDSMIQTLDEFGYDYDRKKLVKLLGIRTHLILKGLGLKFGGRSSVVGGRGLEAVRNKFYKYFTRAAVEGGIKPCVSLKPLWELGKDVPLIVISNARTSYLRASIRRLKIEGLFKGVYGEEKFESKDGMMNKLFKKMKVDAGDVVYVGDRFSDIDFARKAGCIAVAIHNKCSWSTLREIRREKPDYIVRNFYGLRRLIRAFNV
ncbi:MAG TPA: HAD family hydrolase [Candidatus Pacearchaeota archaeon]|nr:HAD family hydrolase [Candidatus Pacearchaeota archaeon]